MLGMHYIKNKKILVEVGSIMLTIGEITIIKIIHGLIKIIAIAIIHGVTKITIMVGVIRIILLIMDGVIKITLGALKTIIIGKINLKIMEITGLIHGAIIIKIMDGHLTIQLPIIIHGVQIITMAGMQIQVVWEV